MKKLITLALALVLALSMSVCAFAAITSDGGQESVTVTGKFQYSGSASEVLVVDVAWEGTEWVYNATKAWSDTQLKEVVTGGTWTNANGGTDVTVTNRSNIKIYVDFEATSTHAAAAVAFESNSAAKVADVEVASAGATATETLLVTTTDTIFEEADNGSDIATITVTIKKAPTAN